MRFLASVVALVALWLLAWGSLDPAKIAAGVVLAVAILVGMPARSRFTPGLGVRPFAMARLVGYLAVNLVVSTVVVAREVLTPNREVRTGILTYPMDDAPPEVVSLLANVIALTPDTLTVDASADPAVVVVHFLRFDDPAAALEAITRLDTLVRAALRSDTPRAATAPPETPS